MSARLDAARRRLDSSPPAPLPGQMAVEDVPLRIGSLCTGYGGLDMAVTSVVGGTLAWVADPDPGATRILAHHHPQVPNLSDLTAVDWTTVPPVDVVTAGYPCQPFSTAGHRKGTADERHIWPHIARALRVLRPQIALFENVSGHLRLGFDIVLSDLAALGFDAEWCTVRASDVGAPHQRRRLFLLAWPAHTQGEGLPGEGIPGRTAECGGTAANTDRDGLREQSVRQSRGHCAAITQLPRPSAADASRGGLTRHGELPAGRDAVQAGVRTDAHGRHSAPAADTARLGRGEGRPEPARQQGRPDPAIDGGPHWGRYAPAIARWEAVTGRRAPRATEDRNRLSSAFVEWLMGLPSGHVTAVPGLSRTAQLRALGNGVVVQQGSAAVRLLLTAARL